MQELPTVTAGMRIHLAVPALVLGFLATVTPPGAAAGGLEQIRTFYDTAPSVHLRAKVTVEVREITISGRPIKLRATGAFEHWETTTAFRSRLDLDGPLVESGYVALLDVAADDSRFYLLDPRADRLAIEDRATGFHESGRAVVPTAVPNPFYLPVHFLARDDDACLGCDMSLDWVRDPERWKMVVGSPKFAGGTRSGQPYEVEVVDCSSEAAGPAPSVCTEGDVLVIRRLSVPDSLPSQDVRLADFRTVDLGDGVPREFPYRIVLTGISPAGEEEHETGVSVLYEVGVVEVATDVPMPTDRVGESTVIWDRGAYLGQGALALP